MTTVLDPHVGKLWVPELSRVTFGPATPGGRGPRYRGIVSYTVRDGQTRKATQKGWGIGMFPEGPGNDALAGLIKQVAHTHNERIQNGGRMLAKSFWGAVSAPQVSTVNAPTYIALNKTSTVTTANFTYAKMGQDLSLGDGVANVAAGITTNEWTTNGLSRALGTVGAYVDPSALDGVFTLTVSKVFTDTTGSSSVYGMGLFDAASTATCNLFMEAPWATATLAISDTITATANISA